MIRTFLYLATFILVSSSQALANSPPLIVAHRGLLQHAPENTLANFRACLELRIGFEFDVQRTKDGHLVCIHDDTVDRTTNGSGTVSEMTLDELRQLDAGSWFAPKFAGEKVPTVDEVLKLIGDYRRLNVLVAVDLKGDDVAAETVRLAEKHDVLERLLFIGRTIREPKVRSRIAGASTRADAAAVANNADEFADALAAPKANWVYVRYVPSSEQLARVHQAKKRAFIAGPTVSGNTPKNWKLAALGGVDAILTDFPLELAAVIATAPSQDDQGSSLSKDGDPMMVKALAEVQGRWTRTVRTERGTFEIVKEHFGRKTTFTVTDDQGRIVEEKNSMFRLENTGQIRKFTYYNNVFTAGPNKGRTSAAAKSYVYRVTGDKFIEVHGLLTGDDENLLIFTWDRVRP